MILEVDVMASYETKRIFGNNLTRIIDSQNKTQLELASALDVSPSSVSYWCNGEKMPRMDKIESIADFLGVSKSDLLEDNISKTTTISDKDIQFALFGGSDEITEKMYEEVKNFAAYVKQRENYGK
jgi:transcriptional regulator with XRE-family HTH domain